MERAMVTRGGPIDGGGAGKCATHTQCHIEWRTRFAAPCLVRVGATRGTIAHHLRSKCNETVAVECTKRRLLGNGVARRVPCVMSWRGENTTSCQDFGHCIPGESVFIEFISIDVENLKPERGYTSQA